MAPWTATKPKTFIRPLGENETFIKMVSDSIPSAEREHWSVNSSIAVVLPESFPQANFEAALRRGWGHLRFQHPSLAAHIAPDGKNIVYEVPDANTLDQWVTSTFVIDEHSMNAAEAAAALKPAPDARIVYVRQSGEVLGHTSHWRSDGVGVFLLLDQLLDFVVKDNLPEPSSLSWGEEVARLALPIEDAAGLQDPATVEQSHIGKSVVESFITTAGGIGIPYLGERSTPPGRTLTTQEVLSAETTTTIIKACKAHGISVTSAVHASVAAANYALAGRKCAKQHYTSTIRFSLRPYLPAPFCGSSHAASIATTGWMDRVESGESWLEYAKHYNALYGKGLSKEYIGAHRAYAAALVELLGSLPANLPIQSDVDISSMGIVEEVMGVKRTYGGGEKKIEVMPIDLGVELLSRQGVCYVWTFRDQMNLSVVYNEAYHEGGQMERFVGEVKRSLLDGFEIQE